MPNAAKTKGGGNGTPKVSLAKSGTINFNHLAATLMGLKGGDKISLAQDEEHPENWYFFKDKDNGFELRLGYDKKGCLFNHQLLIKAFNECFDFRMETKSYLIAGQATIMKGSKTEYWGLLVNGTPVEKYLCNTETHIK